MARRRPFLSFERRHIDGRNRKLRPSSGIGSVVSFGDDKAKIVEDVAQALPPGGDRNAESGGGAHSVRPAAEMLCGRSADRALEDLLAGACAWAVAAPRLAQRKTVTMRNFIAFISARPEPLRHRGELVRRSLGASRGRWYDSASAGKAPPRTSSQ